MGTFLVTKAFLALVGRDKPAAVINITSGGTVNVIPGMSGYGMSKLAMVQPQQLVAAESLNVTTVSLSLGAVATDLIEEAFMRFAKDTPELVGGATVWLAADQAKFLTGLYVSSNWARDEIVGEMKLLTGLKVRPGKDQFE
jgi:NAD(P)-dependent dehydrogenase (short-subunit alcohol dehydrogenase family)